MEGPDHVGICSFSLSGDVPAWIGYRFGCDRENCVMESLVTPPPLWAASLILIWLAVLSYFDMKTRMVPHIAWVFVPCLVAMAYRTWLGGWALSGLVLALIVISERNHLPGRLRWMTALFPIPVMAIWVTANGLQEIMPSLAVIGFWLAWEFRAWGGADAFVAMTIILLWPDIRFLVMVLVCFGLVAISFRLARSLQCRYGPLQLQLPGIPLLAVSVLGHLIWKYLL
jgi:hypothetical protein